MRILGSVAVAALLAMPVSAGTISSLVVLGDSNVDIGRLAAELASDPTDGQVVPPSTVSGRSSDGPLVVEYIAAHLRVPQLNFAWGGATSGELNIVGQIVPAWVDTLTTGTLAQLAEFEASLAGGQADADALYLLWAGSNDLFFPDPSDAAAIDAAVEGAIANLEQAVETLSALGAKDIVLANRTPRPFLSDADSPAEEPDAARKNDAAGRQFNAALADLVGELDSALPADVALFDDYGIIRKIIDGSLAGTNGFTPYSPLPDQYCDGNTLDCSTLINWDGAHKTSAVHAVLADRFIAQFGLVPVPLPASLPLYLVALAGVAAVARRRAA